MRIILQDNNHTVLKIENGEEVMEQVKAFCEGKGIAAATFSCIGAVSDVELWWYDTPKKKYEKKTFRAQLEITGVFGNIAVMDGETIVHAHGTFSDNQYGVLGGHIKSARVSGACEVYLVQLNGTMERAYDQETGLNLLCGIDERRSS